MSGAATDIKMQPKVPIDVKPIAIVKRGGTQHPLALVNREAVHGDLTIMFKEMKNGFSTYTPCSCVDISMTNLLMRSNFKDLALPVKYLMT